MHVIAMLQLLWVELKKGRDRMIGKPKSVIFRYMQHVWSKRRDAHIQATSSKA